MSSAAQQGPGERIRLACTGFWVRVTLYQRSRTFSTLSLQGKSGDHSNTRPMLATEHALKPSADSARLGTCHFEILLYAQLHSSKLRLAACLALASS